VIIALYLMLGRSGSVEWRILPLIFSALACPASAGSVPRLASGLQHKPLAAFQTMPLLKGKSSFEWRGARQNAVSTKAAPVSVGHSMLGGPVVRVTHLNATHAVRAWPTTYQTAHAGTSSLCTGFPSLEQSLFHKQYILLAHMDWLICRYHHVCNC